MSQLGRLVISLEASTAQFTAAMTKAEAQATASMEAISSATKIAGGFLGGLAGAFSLNAVLDWSKGVIAGASALDDLSDVTGSSVENLSKLQNQMAIAGKDFDSVASLVAKLAAGMAGAEDDTTKVGHALAALAIEAKDPAEALQEIAVKLNKYQDGITKAALAKDLFGQKAIQFLAQLKDIANLQDVAATVTAQQAAESEKLEQALRRLSVESTTLKNILLSDLVPAFNAMIDRYRLAKSMGEGFFGATEAAFANMSVIVQGITTATAKVSEYQAAVDKQQIKSPWINSFSDSLKDNMEKLKGAQKELSILIALRDQWIQQNVSALGYTGDARDQRAQNSAASISKEVLAYQSLAGAVKQAKESTYDFAKELEKLYNQLDNNASGINDEFLTKLYMLQGVYEAGDMSLEKYRERVEALIRSTKYGADAIAKMEEAARANNKAFDDAFESIERARMAVENSIRSARMMVEQMEFENSTLTMTNQEREIAIGLRALELQGIQKGTEAYELFAQRIKAAVEQKEGLQSQIQLWKDIEAVATNSIETIIVRGMSGFRDLWENFKAWAIRAIAQIAAQRIVVPIVGQVMGIGGASASGGGGGLGSSFGNLFGGPGGSVLSSLGSMIGGGFGAALGAGFSAGIETLSIAATAGVEAIGGLSSALGALGAVAGPVAGIALAAYAAWQIWGNKGGGPKSGGFFSTGDISGISGTDSSGRWFTPSGEDATVKSIVEATAQSYTALLQRLGGKGSGGFALGFDTDPNGTAPNRVHAGAWVNGVQVYNAALGDLGRDTERLKATLEIESKRAVLAAIQASELPEDIAQIIDALNASTATSEMIDNTIAFAEAVHGLNEVLSRDPVADAMDAVTRATEGSYAALQRSGDAMRELVANYDGSTQATQNLTTATAAFYQQQVALLVQIEQVRQAVESMFGDTIRSLTLTTLDNPGKYNFLMNEANSLMDQLASETDPEKIRALSQRINQDILDAFGLLSPEDQASMLGQFTSYAQAVSDEVSTRLSQIGDDARNTVNDVLQLVKDAFQQAVNDFVSAATTQQTAADTQLAAAQTPLVIDVNVVSTAGAVNA